MIDIWQFLGHMEWWRAALYLGVFAIGIAMPLRAVLFATGVTRRFRFFSFLLITPFAEELVFRAGLVTVMLLYFEPVVAIILSTAIYMIYTALIYGPPCAADGLVIGLLFGAAFLELGIFIVIAAHIVYRLVIMVW